MAQPIHAAMLQFIGMLRNAEHFLNIPFLNMPAGHTSLAEGKHHSAEDVSISMTLRNCVS